MGGTAYTGSRPGYVYTTRHGVTDYYPDAARPSLLTRLASWRGTGPEAVVAEPVGEEDEVAALRQRIAKNGTGRGGRTLGPFGGSAR